MAWAGSRVPSLRFRDKDLGLRVLRFAFRLLNFGFWGFGVWCEGFGLGIKVLGVVFCVWMLGVGCSV